MTQFQLRSTILNMDIFRTIFTEPLANGLLIFYRITGGNMGVAIITFSVFLRFVLAPLTKPYMDSMKKMKSYAKDIQKLKEKHKDDKTKLAKAQADFYKEKGINPSSGCIPYFIQILILIFLFRVFTLVFKGDGSVADHFNVLLYEPLKFAPGESVNLKFLYLDITKPDTLNQFLGLSNFNLPIPGVFLLLASLFQFISAKMSAPYIEAEKKVAKKTKEKSDDFQVAMQSSMVYTFPLMTILIGVSFPSSLALYWLSFSAFQIWQQYRASGWGGAAPLVKKLRSIAKLK